MRKSIAFILLFAAVATAATYDYSTIEAYATVCDRTPDLNITSFSAMPSAPYNDQIVRFDVTVENDGNCYTMNNISLYIDVYDATGANVWNVSRVNDSGLTAQNLGDVQRLPGGNTLVTYSNDDSVIHEITHDQGNPRLVLEIDLGAEMRGPSLGYSMWRETLYGPPSDIDL